MVTPVSVLLLQPPALKPAAPPLGLAVLCGYLRRRQVTVRAVDANLAAYRYLLREETLAAAAPAQPGARLKRALRRAENAWHQLSSPAVLSSFPRYQSAVEHLNVALGIYRGLSGQERLTLGDYRHGTVPEFDPVGLRRMSAGSSPTLFREFFERELLPKKVVREADLIALSINYRHQLLPAFELAGLLRRALPGLRLVAGGGMLTSWRSVLESNPEALAVFDHVIFGPGEEPLAELARGTGPAEFFLEGGSALAFEADFRDLPAADYLSPDPVLPLTASRGCYWRRCLFCPEAVIPTHPFLCCSPAEIADRLRTLARRWRVRFFHFTDNALPLPVLRSLAARRRSLEGLYWYGFVRFEPALADPQLLTDLAGAGCRMLQLGLESGSQAVLDRLAKGTRVETASAVLRALQRAGIASYVYVMFGTPEETEQERLATLEFLEQHADAIGFLNVAIMNLPYQSQLAVGRLGAATPPPERGLYLTGSVERERRARARRFIQRRLLVSPALRAIVGRTPPLFTSDHAVFFAASGGP